MAGLDGWPATGDGGVAAHGIRKGGSRGWVVVGGRAARQPPTTGRGGKKGKGKGCLIFVKCKKRKGCPLD